MDAYRTKLYSDWYGISLITVSEPTSIEIAQKLLDNRRELGCIDGHLEKRVFIDNQMEWVYE